MNAPPGFRTMQKLRRSMLWTLIVITVVAASYIGLAEPFAAYFGADKAWVAAIAPPIMILLVGIALAWLILFVIAPTRNERDRPHGLQRPSTG